MNYPLNLSFKLIAIASQIYVRDAGGNLIYYVKKKAFKLKEAITVFADEAQTQTLDNINADRVFDFSARYNITDTQQNYLGSIKRQGMRSIWKARYDLLSGETPDFNISEENGWVKVLDALLGEVPVVGMFTGYLFNPTYIVTRADGTPVMRLSKEPAFFEGKFKIDKLAEMTEAEEARVVLGLLMMVLLERARG
jgi:uncharacterized protein YxjI